MHGFDVDELLIKYRFPLLIFLVGSVLVTAGFFLFKTGVLDRGKNIEILESGSVEKEITAEVSGAVISPGVYKLSTGARIEDLLVDAGGFSMDADRVWTEKYLNRAAKVEDGQKIYVPSVDNQSDTLSAKIDGVYQNTSSDFSSDSKDLININTASLKELDSLPGIGQVYGQNIIEHRPYSTVGELLSKGVIGQSLYEKIKKDISVY